MLTTSDLMMQTYTTSPASRDLHRAAAQLFRREQLLGWFHRFTAPLLRQRSALEELHTVSRTYQVRSRHYTGLQTVSISAIQGSEARSTDFDHHFHPLSCRSLGRWISIFTARLDNQPMPPVDLIRIGEEYYVRDGHHRISVARALGEEFIEAEVTVWEIAH